MGAMGRGVSRGITGSSLLMAKLLGKDQGKDVPQYEYDMRRARRCWRPTRRAEVF